MENVRGMNSVVQFNTSKEKVCDALFTRFGETYLFNSNLEDSHHSNGKAREVGLKGVEQLSLAKSAT